MKKVKFMKIVWIALIAVSFIACSNDDDNTPEVVNEEEVITTLRVSLTGEGSVVTLESKDLDGDGPMIL